MNTGLLLLRLAIGGALALQGRAKLTKAGRAGTAAFFDEVGFRPGAPLALVAGATELGAGLLLLAGLGTPLAAAGAVGVLVNASVVGWRNGYWNTAGGAEYALVSLVVSAGLGFTGAGRFSLDELLGWATVSPAVGSAALALGVGSALPLLVRRSRALHAAVAKVAVPA
jgi:putative oxidoreductase